MEAQESKPPLVFQEPLEPEYKLEEIDPRMVTLDPLLQQRDTKQNAAEIKKRVKEYVALFKEGTSPKLEDSPKLIRTPDGILYPVDACLTIESAIKAEITKLSAWVAPGTYAQARYFSCFANLGNGLDAISDGDKSKRTATFLEVYENCPLPNEEIARRLKVSPPLVRKLKKKLGIASPEKVSVERNGSTYQMDVAKPKDGTKPPTSEKKLEKDLPPEANISSPNRAPSPKKAAEIPLQEEIHHDMESLVKKRAGKIDLVVTMLPTIEQTKELFSQAETLMGTNELFLVIAKHENFNHPSTVSDLITALGFKGGNILASNVFKAGISAALARFIGFVTDLAKRKPTPRKSVEATPDTKAEAGTSISATETHLP